MCSTNAADLAALEALETMIRELLAEQLLCGTATQKHGSVRPSAKRKSCGM